MSHVAKVDLLVDDLPSLKEAGVPLGMRLVKKENYNWWGHHVGDYPLPEGFTKEDLGKCEYVLQLIDKPDAYEVGVVKRRDGKPGYQLLWDFYAGGRGLEKAIGKDGGLLKQSYAIMRAKKEMLRKGYRATTTKDAKGNVLLTFTE